LGVQAGTRNWLLKLDDAGEMLPLPEFSSVPLTKPWYLGLANIRGVLASIVDFGAFMGGEQTVRTPDCRLPADRRTLPFVQRAPDQPHARAEKRAGDEAGRGGDRTGPGSEPPTATRMAGSGTSWT